MRLANVYRLGLKEMVSLRHDPVLVLLIIYAFTFSIIAPARGVTVMRRVVNPGLRISSVCGRVVRRSRRVAEPAGLPAPRPPELCVVGRSNVGKSSLINTLLNRKRLVKTSSTPGRTQLINFFLVNEAFSLVDLPGYGFAKVPDAVKRQWTQLIEDYLHERRTLQGGILLMDVRHPLKDLDWQMIHWCEESGVQYVLGRQRTAGSPDRA